MRAVWFYSLVCLLMVFAAGWRMASRRSRWLSAAGALFLFCINPVVYARVPAMSEVTAFATVFFAVTFIAVWLWTDHWSLFMRTAILIPLFAAGLWMRAHSALWVAAAFIPWILFSRRPWSALNMFLAIVALGGGLYMGARELAHLLRPQGFESPVREMIAWLRTMPPAAAAFSPQNGGPLSRRLADHIEAISLPWAILSLWTLGTALRNMMASMRPDQQSFPCILGLLAFAASLIALPMDVFPWAALTTFVALSAPAVTAEIGQRDYLFNRSARIAAGWSLAAGVIAERVGGFSLWGSFLALVAAGGLSLIVPQTRRLTDRIRWRAVLLGCGVGACLSANVEILWKLLFKG